MSLILNRSDGNIVLVPGWQEPLVHTGVQQEPKHASFRTTLWIQQHIAETEVFQIKIETFGWIFFFF